MNPLFEERVMMVQPRDPVLNVQKSAVLSAVIVGIIAGMLGFLSDRNLPSAVLVGGGAAANALLLFHSLVRRGGPDERRS